VLTGDVILPKFQRQFVWSRQQTLDLLDSVSRNNPIGSVLLWQSTERLASERTVDGLDVVPQRYGYPVNYILDGQQRLASICGALYWRPDGDPESKWNIVYDLAQQEFHHVTKFDDPPAHVIPTRGLSEPSEFFGRVAQISDQKLVARAKTLFDRFTNYQVAAVTLRGMSVDEVAKVFERINSTHTPLTVVDLIRAATWTPEFDLQDEIDILLTVLERKKYGRVDSKTMLRTIAASAGFGFAREDMQRLRELSAEELQSAVADAAEAAKRAVDFLTTEIGTPQASALRGRGVSSARANVCANLIMLTSVSNIYISDQPPSVYLKDMCDTDGEHVVRARLARSLVNEAAYAAARRDDYEAFLEIRSRTLHERLMDLIGPTGGTVAHYAPLSEEAEASGDDGEPVDRDSAD
jgi:hypothetical protein